MIVFDLETDGLLFQVTQIHCLVLYDTDEDQLHIYNDRGECEPLIRGITRLEEADTIVSSLPSQHDGSR
jgi:hypothetical protein